MLNMNKHDIANLRASSEKAISELQEGQSVRDVLTNLYVSGLPDKTENQGEIMADRVIELVSGYTADCKAAMENFGAWFDQSMEKLLDGKDLAGRCLLLYQIAQSLTAVNAAMLEQHLKDAKINVASVLADMGEYTLDPAAATPELEAELREQVRQALENNSIFIGQIGSLSQLLDQIQTGGDAAETIVNYGVKSADIKAVAAMIAYVEAKKGNMEGIASNVTLDEITIGVCAAIEVEQVAANAESGLVGEDVARLIMEILGAVAAVYLIINLSILTTAFVSLLLPGVFGLIAGLLLGFAVAYTIADAVIGFSLKVADKATDFAIVSVKALGRGLRKLGAWISQAMPGLLKAVSAAVNALVRLMQRGVARLRGQQTATASVRA
jgi:hypothetical protein